MLKPVTIFAIAITLLGAAPADTTEDTPSGAIAVGGVALGDSYGGVTDRAYVLGPPNWAFTTTRASGAFLDCGAGEDLSSLDENGQKTLRLDCGVTLTETVSVPRVGARARLIVHF